MRGLWTGWLSERDGKREMVIGFGSGLQKVSAKGNRLLTTCRVKVASSIRKKPFLGGVKIDYISHIETVVELTHV